MWKVGLVGVDLYLIRDGDAEQIVALTSIYIRPYRCRSLVGDSTFERKPKPPTNLKNLLANIVCAFYYLAVI
jgi:hypothetical protein